MGYGSYRSRGELQFPELKLLLVGLKTQRRWRLTLRGRAAAHEPFIPCLGVVAIPIFDRIVFRGSLRTLRERRRDPKTHKQDYPQGNRCALPQGFHGSLKT